MAPVTLPRTSRPARLEAEAARAFLEELWARLTLRETLKAEPPAEGVEPEGAVEAGEPQSPDAQALKAS